MESFHTSSDLGELRQIASELQNATTAAELRACFDRLTGLKHAFADDFDMLLRIADMQQECVDRTRQLRERPQPRAVPVSDTVELPPDVEPLDPKSWQRAIYIGLFFAVILFAAFFYLIQTARRLNMMPDEQPAQQEAARAALAQPASVSNQPPPPMKPVVRLYTDLVPGTVSIDEKQPESLKDGELVLNSLEPGQHSMKVTGGNGSAEFSYTVSGDEAPRVVGSPNVSNSMAVLVSSEDGKAKLVTNASDSQIAVDGKPAGDAGADGLTLDNLGKTDHLLQVEQGKDKQRFVLTYTPGPALTVYVKADPNTGTVVVITKQDGADVYINNWLYRRKTEAGQLRIPLKVGEYTIRVHKPGFIDPPPETVTVKKADESAVNFRLEQAPQIATLQVKGALPGTMIYIDKDFGATVGNDGTATVPNVKPGTHIVELRRDQALPKRFDRTFKTGDAVVLSGPDVTLEKVVVENTATPPPAPASPATPTTIAENTPVANMQIDGEQVRKGGGFVPYHVPKAAGRYSFSGQAIKSGFLKHGKLQWYAGYQDPQNYILFTVDGKHAAIHEVRNGKSTEVSKIPFDVDSNEWVQVDLSVHPNSVTARVKTPATAWQEVGSVSTQGHDFTQEKVGFYIPDKDEVAIANFRFANR